MKKIILFITLLLPLLATSQVYQITANRVFAGDSLRLGDRWIRKITTNLSSSDSNSHNMIPTNRAVMDAIRQLGPNGISWCNVVNSGADSTGSTDISSYIIGLMNAGCRYIYLPKGRYLISSTVQMRDSVTIKGDGRNNTSIVLASNITAFKTSHALGGYNCQFLDFGFEGNIGTGDVNQTGILIDSTHGSYINNVGGYNMAGWTIKIKRNGYCCGTYTTTGVRGNIISDCYTQGCYGGVAIDTVAEYNTVQNSTFVNGTYGIFVAGGNARINGNNCADNDYGIYLTGGSNNGHGTAIGNTFNHNTSDIYCTGVSLGFSFMGKMVYAGTNQVTVIDCDNINFNGGDIAAGAITITNSTNTTFNDVRITSPTWTITGAPPTVIRNGKIQNAITITDVVNSKDFNIAHNNGIVDFNGNITRMRSFADTINFSNTGTEHLIAGGEAASDSIVISSTTNATKGKIKFGASSVFNESNNRIGLSITNPSTDLHVRRSTTGSVELRLQNDGVGGGASARISLINDGNFLTQMFQGSSTNAFAPSGFLIHTQGAGGMRFAADAGDIMFNRSTILGTSEYARFKFASGNFLYNTTVDVPATGKFQINSTSRFDSLMRLYNVTAPPSTYNVLVHGLSDSGTYQIPASDLSDGNGIYGGNGTLPSDVTVSTDGNTITWAGSNDNETSFSVSNTGTTNASAISGSTTGTTSIGVSGTSTSYIGVVGNSTTSTAIQGQSSSGIGVVGVSSTGAAFRGQVNPVSTNAIENVLTLLRTTSAGAGANGLGAAIQYELETATSGNSSTAGSLAFKWTDATSATRTSQFEIYGVNSTTSARKAALAGNGQWTWDGYGAGTHTGTSTWVATGNASGNIIESPVGNLLELQVGTLQFNDAYMVGQTSPSIITLKSRFQRTVYQITDADFSTLSTRQEGLYLLPDITANRTFSLFAGSGVQGHEFYIYNANTSGSFSWSFTGGTPVKGSDGTGVTTMVNGVLYHMLGLYVNGTTVVWVIVNQ
jgi:hypothetical protein